MTLIPFFAVLYRHFRRAWAYPVAPQSLFPDTGNFQCSVPKFKLRPTRHQPFNMSSTAWMAIEEVQACCPIYFHTVARAVRGVRTRFSTLPRSFPVFFFFFFSLFPLSFVTSLKSSSFRVKVPGSRFPRRRRRGALGG